MHRFFKFKKLNQSGFDHVLLGVAFAVIIALGGTFYLIESHANSWSGSLKLGFNQSYCMENMNNSNVAYTTVDLDSCSTTSEAQHWAFQNDNGAEFQIVAAASNACVDDYQAKVGTNANNRVYLETWPCSSTDHAQFWHWGGTGDHQLINEESGGCINLPGGDISDGGKGTPTASSRLIVYSCSASSSGNGSNAEWIEGSNSASGTTSTPTPAPGTSATGEIQSSEGSNMCVTAGSTVTLQTCQNSASQQWGQVNTASGSSAEQFYNSSTKSYLGLKSDSDGSSVVDTSASANALWTAGDNGDGTNTLQVLTSSDGNLDYCLTTPSGSAGTQLVINDCDSAGSATQSFTLPTPYTSPTTASTGSGSENGNPVSVFTPASPSTNTSGDVSALLQALKSSGYSFNCEALSVSDRSACLQVLGDN